MPVPSLPTTAAEIARLLNGILVGDGAVPLRRFSPIDKAGAEDLTFAENDQFLHKALQSEAGAVLAPKGSAGGSKTLICVEKPRVAFARVLPVFFPEPPVKPGAHPSAVIHPDSNVHPSAQIGPHCVLEDGVEIGPGCVLEGNNFIGRGVSIGEGTRLFAQATVYAGCKIGKAVRLHSGVVVGSDGYGYVFDEGRHVKINQVGNVVIEDWVEIGANSTIDRGALGSTVIGEGTKIDNLVQIAHNVRIGKHCIIVAQTGIAGSATIGDYTTIAGQVGIAGHIQIGSRVTIAGQSGVMHSIPDGEKWFGSPAVPDKQMKRQLIALQKLPELIREFNALKKRFLG